MLLGYVGFTLLEARLYQVSAKRSLENQILVEKDQDENHTGPVINNTATKTGDVLGRMDIPRLGMSVAVLQGTSSRVLRLGIEHIAGTPLPGETGNIGIAGHRDTYFRGLKDIRKDTIRFSFRPRVACPAIKSIGQRLSLTMIRASWLPPPNPRLHW